MTRNLEQAGPVHRQPAICLRDGAGEISEVAVAGACGATEVSASNTSVRKADNRRDRFLTLEEVSRLGGAFEALEGEGASRKALAIGRLWALAGCRRDEIAALRSEEVDLERNLFIFNDTKTGKSIRPFGAAAAILLRDLLSERPSGFVFRPSKERDIIRGQSDFGPR